MSTKTTHILSPYQPNSSEYPSSDTKKHQLKLPTGVLINLLLAAAFATTGAAFKIRLAIFPRLGVRKNASLGKFPTTLITYPRRFRRGR